MRVRMYETEEEREGRLLARKGWADLVEVHGQKHVFVRKGHGRGYAYPLGLADSLGRYVYPCLNPQYWGLGA